MKKWSDDWYKCITLSWIESKKYWNNDSIKKKFLMKLRGKFRLNNNIKNENI